ncbi:hypothetical protein MMPV_006694 [Pyropia vietnamensis]
MDANGSTAGAGGKTSPQGSPPAPATAEPRSLDNREAAAAVAHAAIACGVAAKAAGKKVLPHRSVDGAPPAVPAEAAVEAVSAAASTKATGTTTSGSPAPARAPASAVVDPRQAVIAEAVRTILGCLDATPSRPGLAKTPDRVAKALLYCTAGGNKTPADVVGDAIWDEQLASAAAAPALLRSVSGNGGHSSKLVLVRSIRIYSLCEHHLLPFFGTATVAYVPGAAGTLIGLSKLARLADAAARSLQVQERLTAAIAEAVAAETRAAGVAILINATHLCMAARGVAQGEASTVTTAWLGEFAINAALRAEFLTMALQ